MPAGGGGVAGKPGSHRGGAPTQNISEKPEPTVGAPAPGANVSRRWRGCRKTRFAPGAVLLVSLPECWLATNTLVGRKPVALLRAMTLRRRSGSDLSLNLYGIWALPKRDEAA